MHTSKERIAMAAAAALAGAVATPFVAMAAQAASKSSGVSHPLGASAQKPVQPACVSVQQKYAVEIWNPSHTADLASLYLYYDQCTRQTWAKMTGHTSGSGRVWLKSGTYPGGRIVEGPVTAHGVVTAETPRFNDASRISYAYGSHSTFSGHTPSF